MTRKLQAFLAVVLVFALILCGGCTTGTTVNESNSSQDYGYKKSKMTADVDIWDVCMYDDAEYLLTYTNGKCSILCSRDGQTSILAELPTEDTYWLCIAAGDSGLFLLESQFIEKYDECTEAFRIITLDHNGSICGEIELGYPSEAVYDIEVDIYGKIYVQYAQFVSVLDSGGNQLYEVFPENEYVDSLIRSGSGNVFISSISDDSSIIQCFSSDGVCVEKEYELPANSLCCDGFENYDLLVYVNDGIYGVIDTNTEILLDCSESGISFSLPQKFFAKANGDFICLDNSELFLLDHVPVREIVPREILTMAVMGDNNLQWMVRLYNAESERYYIEVKDYFADTNDFFKGVEQLNMDIVSGSAPDLINFAGLSFDQYAEKGLLEDLGALINAEPGIEITDYYVLDELTEDGALYVASPAFMLMTYCGLSANFPDGNGCTYEELEKLMAAYPNLSIINGIAPEGFVVNCISNSYDDLIDWENGSSCFNSDFFMEILRIAETAASQRDYDPENTDLENLISQSQLLMPVTLMSIQDISKLEKETNGTLAFVGWPTSDGSNGTLAYLADPVAINAGSSKKDGAWDFIKYIMSDEKIQRTVAADCFPINKAAVSAAAYEDTIYQKFLYLVENVHRIYQYNSTITDIITEESASYFAGDKTAEETAKIIQNRVQTYLSERG